MVACSSSHPKFAKSGAMVIYCDPIEHSRTIRYATSSGVFVLQWTAYQYSFLNLGSVKPVCRTSASAFPGALQGDGFPVLGRRTVSNTDHLIKGRFVHEVSIFTPISLRVSNALLRLRNKVERCGRPEWALLSQPCRKKRQCWVDAMYFQSRG